MLHIEPSDLAVKEVHRLLLGGVGPRPIALVSTVSKDGILNLTPFSFFNVFGANPPIIAFSPSRRGRNATLKDTYYNLMDNGECVVQSVTYSMVEQINLASTEYDPGIDEFVKSGLTPVDSDIVKPKRVQESPFQMECKLREMRSFGEGGASANIAICEVLKFHVAEDIFKDGVIHPDLIDLAASEATGKALTPPELELMHIHKTGALIRAAVAIGAACGERLGEAQEAKLDHYAKCVGLAFQVVDDVLDAESSTATLGKTAGKDARQGKTTYVSTLGAAGAREFAETLRRDAHAALADFGARARRLGELADYIVLRKF